MRKNRGRLTVYRIRYRGATVEAEGTSLTDAMRRLGYGEDPRSVDWYEEVRLDDERTHRTLTSHEIT